jgi:hypothetical protein
LPSEITPASLLLEGSCNENIPCPSSRNNCNARYLRLDGTADIRKCPMARLSTFRVLPRRNVQQARRLAGTLRLALQGRQLSALARFGKRDAPAELFSFQIEGSKEAKMLKALIVGLFTLALIGSADAQVSCPNGAVSYCPPGQCGVGGKTWACYKRNCKAKYCPHN